MHSPNPCEQNRPSFADAALIDRLARREPAAVEALLREFGPAMLAAARSVLGDENEARDAVQDAVLSALGAMGTLDDPAALAGWLRRIALNAALGILRKRRRHRECRMTDLLPRYRDDGHLADPEPVWTASFPVDIERRELLAVVREAIERLPPSYREVLILRDVIGIDTREAAELLEIEPNLVKVRLHRARQALRTLLEGVLPRV
jgi:RNA polymerase sigma-70 factor (ECF subfamily)